MDIPKIDEHRLQIAAGSDAVWDELLGAVDRAFSHTIARVYARVIRCDDLAVTGPRPHAVGSAVPGFHVTEVVPGSRLVLQGHHRFSTYTLTFQLEGPDPNLSHLAAETRATFPGRSGSFYRTLVIGTGGHVVLVRRLLATVKTRSEYFAPSKG